MGEDLNISVSVLVPADASHHITQVGPYFRSRAAAAGDGIIGGTYSGYWVFLDSTGEVNVIQLNPMNIIAFTGPPPSLPDLVNFDPTAFHTIEMAGAGTALQVALDGYLQTFNQGGNFVTSVAISNAVTNGTVGIAFGASDNRGLIGGQRADSLVVSTFESLDSLPVQNNFTCRGAGSLKIFGTVKGTSSNFSGVTVTLDIPAQCTDSVPLGSSGIYKFGGLAAGTYTVTPSKAGCSFTPPSEQVIISSGFTFAPKFTESCP